jgi:prepilin-type processing-associated H-X9-DG protein
VQILPYIGQNNIYRNFNFQEGVYEASNQTVVDVHIATLLCPSDSGRGRNSYAGCHHDTDAPIDTDNHGVLYLNSRVRLDDIPDGAASTILLGEARHGGPSLGWASGTRSTLRNTGIRINAPDPLATAAVFAQLAPGTSGAAKATPANPAAPAGSQLENYETVRALAGDELWPLDLTGGFSSYHGPSANFLFCDGSVRMLSATIAQHVYRFLGNRDDGEPLSTDSY